MYGCLYGAGWESGGEWSSLRSSPFRSSERRVLPLLPVSLVLSSSLNLCLIDVEFAFGVILPLKR